MKVLVVNAGSSTLKLAVLDGDATEPLAARTFESLDAPGDVDDAIGAFVTGAPGSIDAVGHRVVHGGTRFTSAALIDDDVERELEALTTLAPLHQPAALAAIGAARRVLPDHPHVACFDTAFHASMPAAAATYALPAEWRARWPLRRFGFHGLSHAYASRRGAELAGLLPDRARVVTCHLGAGASLCAVDGGRSVDTTMGFTPLEGIVMATRSGSVDPGMVTWLQREGGLSATEVDDALEHRSGLLGLCGSADMRVVVARRAGGDADASLAFDVYCHALRRALGGMFAVLGGADVVVFTGGVGEHAPEVRASCGLTLDEHANASTTGDGEIGVHGAHGAHGASPRIVVVRAREDLEITRQVHDVLG